MTLNSNSLYTWEEFQKLHLQPSIPNESFPEDLKLKKTLDQGESGSYYVNWVGTLDFSPVRSNNTTTCQNPYWALVTA